VLLVPLHRRRRPRSLPDACNEAVVLTLEISFPRKNLVSRVCHLPYSVRVHEANDKTDSCKVERGMCFACLSPVPLHNDDARVGHERERERNEVTPSTTTVIHKAYVKVKARAFYAFLRFLGDTYVWKSPCHRALLYSTPRPPLYSTCGYETISSYFDDCNIFSVFS